MFPDGRLIVCNFSGAYGSNGYVLDSKYKKHVATIAIDPHPKELSLSSGGKRLAVIADADVLCITDLVTTKELFFTGKRIRKDPSSVTGVIDAPFYSHLRHDGKNTVVCTRDNSWSTGEVEIYDMATKKKIKEFDAHNGHIEMDVDFEQSRIALTGTSHGLMLMDFEGKVIASLKNATEQRNVCVEFFSHPRAQYW